MAHYSLVNTWLFVALNLQSLASCLQQYFPVDYVRASTHNNRMKVKDIVIYSKPQKGEEDIRFVLLEINGDRVLIEMVCDWAIKPTEVVAISEVCKADE